MSLQSCYSMESLGSFIVNIQDFKKYWGAVIDLKTFTFNKAAICKDLNWSFSNTR